MLSKGISSKGQSRERLEEREENKNEFLILGASEQAEVNFDLSF